MPHAVIELEAVSKRYRLGEHLGGATDLRESIMTRLGRRTKDTTSDQKDLWAIRDLSLSVSEGEALGVIGRNGAGKSTFLKIVAGVTTPTSGVAKTRGRVGSLLEVGTGFHDDLTGRENTYLSGAILGMGRSEVSRQLDEIVAFAGLDRFLDTPVKRYSSGMYLRLAFAVAAHLEADILLVDEVLAVGDAEFRRKCLSKMSEVESSGRAVVFASHNLEALTELCTNAIWLDKGVLAAAGPAKTTVRSYLDSTTGTAQVLEFDTTNAAASLRSIAVLDTDRTAQSVVPVGEPLTIELNVDVADPTPDVDIGIVVERQDGTVLLDENLVRDHAGLSSVGRHRVRMQLPPVLTPAKYVLSVWLGNAYEDIAFHEHLLTFEVDGDDADRSGRLFDLRTPWQTDWIDI